MNNFFNKLEEIWIEKLVLGKKSKMKGFDQSKIIKVISPGRLNIIGEHTDYNNGFSLPMAIDKYKYFAAVKNNSKKVEIFDNGFNEYYDFSLDDDIEYDSKIKWSNYLKGVIKEYRKDNKEIEGFSLLIDSDLLSGSGLSSSAAMLLGTSKILEELFCFKSSKEKILNYCHDAENKFIGVNSGFLDHFSVLYGRQGHAIFLNFNNLDYQYVPICLKDYLFLIIDSREERYLPSTDYNKRRSECVDAVNAIREIMGSDKIRSLSDLDLGSLDDLENKIDRTLFKRVKHVLKENKRVLMSMDALNNKDIKQLGELLLESHVSLKNDYEVSTEKLDFLVENLMKIKGVLGARLMGAGFGGCIISLIEKEILEDITMDISNKYFKKFNLRPNFIHCQSSDGVHRID